ncbi:hypothetical protein [Kribbella sp. VKM Ac-2568]|uniref:hypothetical protein n=1 Tax=Kribbella sp. VKM Ac-2568 TaxID=2512219 RepID=UPI001048FB6C|nr:hypothetical protein [Kribbella sp. VKM Ac-2568]TCM36209.1 hypothetical protein EV648_12274 [Kribbella sp. VKM Ac-2568]
MTVPYTLTRLGVVMTPKPGNDLESEGVLNPASGHTPDEEVDGVHSVFYGMADAKIGVARLDRSSFSSTSQG